MSLQGKIYVKFVIALNRIVRSQLRPNIKYNSINDIDFTEIKRLKQKYGIGGMILDVDGTIFQEFKNIPPSIIRTLKLLNKEFKIYFVSNGKNKRIEKLAQILDVGYIPHAFKPRRKPFIKASSEMGLMPENIMVVGDGFLTDVLGGQRMGMYTATVKSLRTVTKKTSKTENIRKKQITKDNEIDDDER